MYAHSFPFVNSCFVTDITYIYSIHIQEAPLTFYGFWGYSHNTYASNEPHEGYHILKKWCCGKKSKLKEAPSSTPSSSATTSHGFFDFSPYFVYTSNVDGHFKRIGFEPENVLELHGSLMSHHVDNTRDCNRALDTSRSSNGGGGGGGGDDIDMEDEGNKLHEVSGWFCTRCYPQDTATNGGEKMELIHFGIDHRFDIDATTMKLRVVDSNDVEQSRTPELHSQLLCGPFNCPKCSGEFSLRPYVHMFSESHQGLLQGLSAEEVCVCVC
jgi:hypothetical protein